MSCREHPHDNPIGGSTDKPGGNVAELVLPPMKMFLSSLLRSSSAPPAGSPNASTPPKPPPGFSRAEAQAWQALSGKAASLHESLEVASAIRLAPGLVNRPNQNLLPPSQAFGAALVLIRKKLDSA